MSARHENIKIFLWEGLLETRPNQRKGSQLHLTENFSDDIFPPLFRFHQKTSVEILTARYRFYFHKKLIGANENQFDNLNLQVFYGELIDFQ